MTELTAPEPFTGVFAIAATPFTDAVRHPFAPLDEANRAGLLALAREFEPLLLHWGK